MNIPKERELPYNDTKVSVEKSELDIKALFKKHGIDMVQTTQIKDKYFYKFMFKDKPYLIEIPDIPCLVRINGGYKKGVARKEISMRFLYYFLKTTLEQARYIDAEQLLLSYRMVKTDEGKITTIGKLIDTNPNLLLAPGDGFE